MNPTALRREDLAPWTRTPAAFAIWLRMDDMVDLIDEAPANMPIHEMKRQVEAMKVEIDAMIELAEGRG